MNATSRNWTHEESPTGQPSAASYRTGCRCTECYEANRTYQRAYRARKVLATNKENTTDYHSHVGQPSKRTAVRWKCIHPHCLAMAGLTMGADGQVHDLVTGKIDLRFPKVEAA